MDIRSSVFDIVRSILISGDPSHGICILGFEGFKEFKLSSTTEECCNGVIVASEKGDSTVYTPVLQRLGAPPTVHQMYQAKSVTFARQKDG